MTERPQDRAKEEELEPERQRSTDLGYRDTEEECAYEDAADEAPEPGEADT